MKTIYLVVVRDDGGDRSFVLATHDPVVAEVLADRALGNVERVPCLDDELGDDE